MIPDVVFEGGLAYQDDHGRDMPAGIISAA
jgi:hypothetical protein